MVDRRYRSLALFTFWSTFALIVVGGFVRVSDSGLGCGPAGSGTHGWPFCEGRVVPILDANMIVEYTHRTLASVVGVLLIALVVLAWKNYRRNTAVVRLSTLTLALVVGEGLLGGLTVEHGLHPWLVAVHLGISMLIAGLLMLLVAACGGATQPTDTASIPTRIAMVLAPALTWSTIVAGGYVAGTQRYGTPDHGYSVGAHMACGDRFPGCLGSWWPFGIDEMVDLQLLHRALMYATAAAVIWLAVIVWRRAATASARTVAAAGVVVLLAQILLGAMNVWYGEHRGMILAHLTLGTALWLVTLLMAWNARSRRQDGEPAAVDSTG